MPKKDINYKFKALVLKVVDGDTIDAVVDLGFDITTTQRFRIARIDAYEMTSKDQNELLLAHAAKNELISMLHEKPVVIETFKSDRYGRYIAEIFYGEINISDYLLEKKLVKLYK